MLKFLVKEPDPKELVRKWQSSLRTEQRGIDKSIRDIQFEVKKVHKNIKEAAKRGDMGSAKALAREVVQSKRAIGRLYTNKAQLISISTALTEQLAMLRLSGALNKSTEVMKAVNMCIKAPELQKTMIDMSKEMMKAGLIDEMMTDAIDSAMDTEDMEDETEAEVDKVMAEIAAEVTASLPAARRAKQAVPQQAEAEEEDAEAADMQARLDAIRT